MYYIHQTRKDDCGFASLKMLLATLNKDNKFLYLKEVKTSGSYSFKEISLLAKEHNVSLTGYRVKNLSCLKKLNKSKLPFLLTIKSGKGKHLVLARKVMGNLFFIKDPALGTYFIFKNKLEKIMEGSLLIVNEFKKSNIDVYFPSLIKKLTHAILICLRLSCVILIILSTFFIDKSFDILIPLAFLIGGLMMELIYRIIALRIFNKLDKVINDKVVVINNKYYDYYSYLQKYKSLYLNNLTSLIFVFTLTVFVSYLLIVNEILNVIPFIFTLVFVLLEHIIFKRYIKNQNFELELEEFKLAFSKDMDDYKNKIAKINNKSQKIATFNSIFDLGYFFVLIFLLMLNMSFRQTIDITYLIFYFFVFHFFKKCLKDIFLYSENREKEKEYKVRLLNLTNYNNDFECK